MKKIAMLLTMIMLLNITVAEEAIGYKGLTDGDTRISKINFTDMSNKPKEYWSKDAVYKMSALGIINGVGNKMFKPSASLTNEQAITLILNAIGKEEDVAKNTNTTSEDTWSDKYIRYAINEGIVTGKIIMKMSDIGNKTSISALKKSGVIIRDDVITRQELASMIVRALKLTGSSELNFHDKGEISDEDLANVKIVVSNNIMSGSNNNMFYPNKYLSREEMAQVLKNAEKYILESLVITKKEGQIEEKNINNLTIKNEEETVDIDLTNKNIPVLKNGVFGGKSLLREYDEVTYYINESGYVEYINAIGEDEEEISASGTELVKSAQGIVLGNSPYFETISIKDVNNNEKTYIYGAWTKFYKEGKEVNASDIEQNDTIYIEFDDIGNAIKISAVANYNMRQGVIIDIDGYNIKIKNDEGSYANYNLNNIPIYKNGAEIKYEEIKKGDALKIYSTSSKISKAEVAQDKYMLENTYMGIISSVNLLQDKIIIQEAMVFKTGRWEDTSTGVLTIPIDNETKITFYGKNLAMSELGELQVGKTAYIATRQDTSELYKAKEIRIDVEAPIKTFDDEVSSFNKELGEIRLKNSSNRIHTDESTIIIEQGKIIEGLELEKGDKVLISTERKSDQYLATVIQIEKAVVVKDIELYAGEIYEADGREYVTLKRIADFIDDEWSTYSNKKYADFYIKQNTRIIGDAGPINIKDFTTEENNSENEYKNKGAYILAKGSDIVELSVTNIEEEPFIMKGVIRDIEEKAITVKNVEYYDFEEEEWIDEARMTIEIVPETIIVHNGNIIKAENIEETQEVTVIKSSDLSDNKAKVIIINN